MAEDFAKGVYDDLYKDCLPTSECINSFHKSKEGILYLLCRNFRANATEIVFRNLLYNLRRPRSLKDSVT